MTSLCVSLSVPEFRGLEERQLSKLADVLQEVCVSSAFKPFLLFTSPLSVVSIVPENLGTVVMWQCLFIIIFLENTKYFGNYLSLFVLAASVRQCFLFWHISTLHSMGLCYPTTKYFHTKLCSRQHSLYNRPYLSSACLLLQQ